MQLLHSIFKTWRKNFLRTLIVDDFRSWRGIDLQVASWHVRKAILEIDDADHVGVMLPTSGLFPVVASAIWSLGKTVVPLNYLLSADEIAYIVHDAELKTVVTVGPMLDMVGGLPEQINIISMDAMSFRGIPPVRRSKKSSEEFLAALLYTSGTSGKPKGVMLSEKNIRSNVQQCCAWSGFHKHDSFLGLLPQFHSFGFTVTTMLPMVIGAKAMYSARFNPRKTFDLLRTHRPTAMLAIPSMFNALLNSKSGLRDDFSSLRFAVSGGEALPDAVFEGMRTKFGLTINEGYGLTETSPVTNWCRPDEHRRGSVGMPITDVHERIVDPHGNDVPIGQDGEVRIAGPNIMQGYYKLPEETAAAFDERGYFRSGDMGQLDAEGFLYITGRIKEMLIIGGENVFPREIEEVLTKHPSVSAVGVVGRQDVSRGEVAVAFVELVEGEVFDEQALRSWCRETLASFKVPKSIYQIDALPRNPTGKIMRRELTALVQKEVST
ncbi:MAG: AMP-binding protein [Phycisphaerales bacterium]|jgi:long-chain acyl-CoA synthetase|nr:AMP-binding protein [Phycisphaerales bacterium]